MIQKVAIAKDILSRQTSDNDVIQQKELQYTEMGRFPIFFFF